MVEALQGLASSEPFLTLVLGVVALHLAGALRRREARPARRAPGPSRAGRVLLSRLSRAVHMGRAGSYVH